VSEQNMWAVYLDYEMNGQYNTIILGGSIFHEREEATEHLGVMRWGGEDWNHTESWFVDEGDLPHGYSFQTYYVAPYYGADIAEGILK
jgi:hypothetical protein